MALAGLLMFALLAVAGHLEPSAPPGPTMKTLYEVEPRIPISSLPYTISTPGSYYLTGDLTATGTGITVNADNVTIDLMGYSLIGSGSGDDIGIRMVGRQNVEIRNGTVRGYGGHGIYDGSGAGEGYRVIAVRAMSNGGCGILLAGKGHLVKECTAAGNWNAGIVVCAGTVIYNTACNNRVGISADNGCTVIGNTAYWNQEHGIALSNNSLVDQNTAYHNNRSGGGYTNINSCPTCTFGLNHAP